MHSTRSPKRTTIAALGWCGLICGIAAVLAACGLQKSPASGAGSGAGSGTGGRTKGASATSHACTRSDIRVRVDIASAGVAAGTSYIPLDFTNVSAAMCRLAGFPVVTLATGSAGQQIGSAATADRSLAAENLTLGSGKTAHIWLRLADVTNLPAKQCRPVTADGLRIGLPGQGAAIFVRHPVITCASRVNGTDLLIVEPFQPGRARPGTAQ